MNPSGTPPPSLLQRSLQLNLLLLFGLVVCFVWFLFIRMKEVPYETLDQAGSAALAKKDTGQARKLFDEFLQRHPSDPLSYMVVSEVCTKYNQPAMAVEYAQRGIDACKNAPKPQMARLYLELSQGQSLTEPAHPQVKAIASARTALSLDPQDSLLQNAVGYMLVDNDQNLDEAEKLLRQALQSLPEPDKDSEASAVRPAVEDSFGWLLYKKGDYTGAVAALNQSVHDLAPGTAGFIAKYFYYHLAAAYRKAGQADDARRTLDIALEYDPDFPEAKAERALLPPQNTPAAQAPVPTPPASSATISADPPIQKP